VFCRVQPICLSSLPYKLEFQAALSAHALFSTTSPMHSALAAHSVNSALHCALSAVPCALSIAFPYSYSLHFARRTGRVKSTNCTVQNAEYTPHSTTCPTTSTEHTQCTAQSTPSLHCSVNSACSTCSEQCAESADDAQTTAHATRMRQKTVRSMHHTTQSGE
jgi:hypothetical protein